MVELGALLLGGAVFMSVFFIWGSLTLPSLLLLWASGPIYVAAYAGFGAVASVWCRRSTHAILAGWSLLAGPRAKLVPLPSLEGLRVP